MHTVADAGRARRATKPRAAPARVAIAGATGYTGQELLRILSRHPVGQRDGRDVVGHDRARGSCPRWPRLWNGDITPLSPECLREADVVFLALPDAAAAELGTRARRRAACGSSTSPARFV